MSVSKAGEEIGEVMHVAKSGRLIVKLNAVGARIKAGELLVDSSGKRIGRIAELIGAVRAPYASVIPMTDKTNRLVGAKVFAGGMTRTFHGQSRKTDRRFKRR